MPYHPINPHLEPFLPYVEKAQTSRLEVDWHFPDNLTKPISLDALRSWLTTCDRFHAAHCGAIPSPRVDERPAWLVDVRRNCIVPWKSGFVYATLSYVWGKAEGFSLTGGTLDDLLIENSLNHADLPRTIREAMALVAALDLTHLWVDRLCIVQDSESEKHAQIKAMASIYSNSYFTIIAAQSHDASGPLSSRTLSNASPSIWDGVWRRLHSLVSRAKRPGRPPSDSWSPWGTPQTHREVLNIMSVDLLRSVWYSRGWTFQEFLFSRRKIVFHNNTVNWECHCTSAHEGQQSFPRRICPRPPVNHASHGLEIDQWPNFHRFARLVSLFTTRQLTFPEDVLDAFAGASTALARVYQGGLITGIPALVFDAALLWQPYHPMERRRSAAVPEEEAILPSWSWVSWRGNIHSEAWQSGYDYLKMHSESGKLIPRWTTSPTVEWYHSQTLDSTRTHIAARASEWRIRFGDGDVELPPGWRRIDRADGKLFVHEQVPDKQFWHPIPIGLGDGRALRSRYLHCKTRHAKLDVFPNIYSAFASGCAVLALRDPNGGFAGCLRINSFRDDVPKGCLSQSWHLIELSAGAVHLGDPSMAILDHPFADVFDEWSLPLWKRNGSVYEFYNVMHVEWVSPGVASRLAVGRVEKRVWERVAVERIEVAIG
ncbi:heterokaryon incompatibility protein-domain-containing protein [Echria macrotheca]|uniref:Heterokaryon incompatibility protein-domain-containing protein n=1 Tax=Echria macrotheca TaxID=438768 RepID=A0AAJ0B9Y4_9PEZI|nr:heterokaryon incompatibility protein-domain-containing protein [Echria macrotheca]